MTAKRKASNSGIKRPEVRVGKLDPVKTRIAKKADGVSNGMSRTAGMMIDSGQQSATYQTGYRLEAYRSSYAYGLGDKTGAYDVPLYFSQMNQQNGGLIYWPVTLAEKYQWYRYFARTDAYVGRGLELLSDLPMSKLTLHMPKLKDKKKQKLIKAFFKEQLRIVNMFEVGLSLLYEYNCIGNVFLFHEWDEEKCMWTKIIMLPPEEVGVFQYPFSDEKRFEYRPQRLIQLIRQYAGFGSDGGSGIPDGDCGDDLDLEIVEHLPDEVIEMVSQKNCIVMDADPMTGSFVYHFARRKTPYMDLGSSVLERILIPMLQKEHYRYTQLSLASRNMTPRNVVSAPELMPEEVDDLRTQIDMSMLDPDYTIVTNYAVDWNQIGSQDRLLDLNGEYELIDNQVFAALGVPRDLLTGEGTFGGNRVTLEIMNTMFNLVRELLKNYIEQQLFVPICEKKKWYSTDENGIKTYWHPTVGFNRITIRDNQEVFESLFQLYQKGSLPIEVIYELFNLNSDEINEQLKRELFTVKDATFNRMLEEVSSEVGRGLVDNTDILEKVIDYLGLKKVDSGEGVEDGMDEFELEDESPFAIQDDEPDAPTEQSEDDDDSIDVSDYDRETVVESAADAAVDTLTDNPTDEDIDKAAENAANVVGG